MRPRLTVMLMLGLICTVLLAAPLAWAGGAGGEGDPVCLVKKNDVVDPPGAKITGTLAIDATSVSGGIADVVMRLARLGDVKFVRSLYLTTTFTAPTLLAVQNRLCEILTIPQVVTDIKAAFGLPSVTHFVFTKRGIRDTEIDVAPESLAILGSGQPPHAMTMADIVIFGQ